MKRNAVKQRRFNKKTYKWLILLVFLGIILSIGMYQRFKPLPAGLSFEGDVHYTDQVDFLVDLTYEKNNGKMTSEQEIFEEVFNIIKKAKEVIVVDMFLFNSYTDQERDFPDLSGKLTEALIDQKQLYPDLQIVFITDPINTGYYSYEEEHIQLLEKHGIEVVLTNLSKLRDSNKVYSSAWRLLFQPFGQNGRGWLPNPFASEAPDLTLRSYLALFNVKANHRKVVITENNALVASANPHNESGFASNIAFKVSGEIIKDMMKAEQAVIDYSGGKTQLHIPNVGSQQDGDIAVQYLTEGKILKHLLHEINKTEKDDTIWIGMFYIANRGVIDGLHEATERGVAVHLILDPNKVAFGNQKTGLPNVPVASELKQNEDLSIRWYHAEEDQYHTKLMYIKKAEESVVIGGSANYTTRNLDDLNLENNIKITAKKDAQVMQEVEDYFVRLWENKDGLFTLDYEANEDGLTPLLKTTYWLQKLTGFTTY